MAQLKGKNPGIENITPVGSRGVYATPLGTAVITEQEGFITAISITDSSSEDAHYTPGPATLLAIKQLDEYFAGKRLEFDFPMKPNGTVFQQEVWRNLLNIPYGQTMSYAGLSKLMNNPLAIRAIAAANGQNPLWIVVPCHRVIGSNGSLTGYAGGLWRKQWLLEHETKVLGIGQVIMEF